MFISPQNTYIQILVPYGIVLAGGAFGGWVGHECWVLMVEINAIITEAGESYPAPPTK